MTRHGSHVATCRRVLILRRHRSVSRQLDDGKSRSDLPAVRPSLRTRSLPSASPKLLKIRLRH